MSVMGFSSSQVLGSSWISVWKFFARSSIFPLRGYQLKLESSTVAFPSPSSPQGLPFVTWWLSALVRVAPYLGSQGEVKLETTQALPLSATVKPGWTQLWTWQAWISPETLRCWSNMKPGTCYSAWQNHIY